MLHRNSVRSPVTAGGPLVGRTTRRCCVSVHVSDQVAAQRPAGPPCVRRASASESSKPRPRATPCCTRAIKASASGTSEVEYKIYSDPDQSVEAIRRAQAAAEAEQQRLMTTGPVADAMKDNQLLNRMMQHHATLQRLYHKGVQRILQRIPHYVGNVPGTIYALCHELLSRPVDKKPGDSITTRELDNLEAEVMLLPADTEEEDLLKYTLIIKELLLGEHGTEVFVVQDFFTAELESHYTCLHASQVAKQISKLMGLNATQAFALASHVPRETLRKSLLMACQPADSPPQAEDAEVLFQMQQNGRYARIYSANCPTKDHLWLISQLPPAMTQESANCYGCLPLLVARFT